MTLGRAREKSSEVIVLKICIANTQYLQLVGTTLHNITIIIYILYRCLPGAGAVGDSQ